MIWGRGYDRDMIEMIWDRGYDNFKEKRWSRTNIRMEVNLTFLSVWKVWIIAVEGMKIKL